MSRRIAGLLLIAGSIAGYLLWPTAHKTDPSPVLDEADIVVAADQLNGIWAATFDKTGEFPPGQQATVHADALKALIRIPTNSEHYEKASELRIAFATRQVRINDAERRRRLAAVENDIEGRKRFAKNIDITFLKAGSDVGVAASGPKNTVLTISYVLMNRPLVYQIETQSRFLQNAWDAGFKKVILTDGRSFGANVWTFEAP